MKGSRYYQTIPPVQVECPLLDGDPTSIPIIFEDKYSFSEPREPGTYKPLCFGDFEPKLRKLLVKVQILLLSGWSLTDDDSCEVVTLN